MKSIAIITFAAIVSSASAGHYGLAAPLYGAAVSAPLAYGGALVASPAIASIHAPAYAAPLVAGAAYQTGDYSRVSTVHGVHPGLATLAAPIGAVHAAPLHAGLHAGLVAPAYAAPVHARLGAAVVSPYGLAAPLAHSGAIRLIK